MNRHSIIRIALLVTLLCVLVSGMALADETKYVKTNGGHLNVRREPSTEAEIITRLDYGQQVNVIGYDGDWAEINMRLDGGLLNGYVARRYLSSYYPGVTPTPVTPPYNPDPTDYSTALSALNAQYRSMVASYSFTVYSRPARAGGFVNLRWGPSTETEVIQRCYAGYSLEVIAVGNAWYQVRDPMTGLVGFIMKQYTSQ